MPDGPPNSRTATAAVILAVIVFIVVAGAIFKLGPFADDSSPVVVEINGDFATSADQICTNAHSEFSDQQKGQPKTASEAALLTKNLLDVAQTELDQIRVLTPPPGMRSKVEAYLKAREQGVKLLKQGISAADNDDFGGYESAQAKLAAGQPARQRLAQGVGLKVCSQPSLDANELAQQSRSPGDTSLDRPNQVGNPPGPP